MKKFFLLCLFLAGCAGVMVPPKTVRYEKCFTSDKLVIFQVLDNGALAYLCPVTYPPYFSDAFAACTRWGDFVFLSAKTKDSDLFDGERIMLSDSQCFMPEGVFKYESRDKIAKTVRKIKVIESQVANPAYAEYVKKQVASEEVNE
ncbi:MAG: hypothetical protein LBU87_00295 [Lactobacillales bacterium]|jgi:hypothetical protein|nr:hypothetical protein [Lactobacillales bacterium]